MSPGVDALGLQVGRSCVRSKRLELIAPRARRRLEKPTAGEAIRVGRAWDRQRLVSLIPLTANGSTSWRSCWRSIRPQGSWEAVLLPPLCPASQDLNTWTNRRGTCNLG